MSDLFRWSVGLEMNPLHYGVGLEQNKPIGNAKVQHGAIIPGADDDRIIQRQCSR
jgi:hypothetical protein